MPAPLIDTNVVLRHLLGDHSDHSPRATRFLARVARGDVTVTISDTTIVEAVFSLERVYKRPKGRIRDGLLDLINDPNVKLAGKARWRRILNRYVDENLEFGDAQQLDFMVQSGISQIITFDRGFGRIPGITRIEP